MIQVIEGSSSGFPDVRRFLEVLGALNDSPIPEARSLFEPGREVVVTRAPGRLDVMGGIADYSGSLVLQLPISEATLVALQRDPARRLRIVSLNAEANHRAPYFEMPLDDFGDAQRPVEYAEARSRFQQDSPRSWAAYVAGAFLVLMRELGKVFPEGARILISSDVPEGKGVSSSAALEVAAMQAICSAFDISIAEREMALLCQKVENLVVGAPCGVMDQMTAVSGQSGRLLTLLCQPAQLLPFVEIPDEVAFWGIDSGVRHSVSGSDYTSVRVGAFMGYRIIADIAGLTVRQAGHRNLVHVEDLHWHGYLANLTPSEFEQRYRSGLPDRLGGDEFLRRYGGTTDPVTRIDPDRVYEILQPAAHPIYEHFRVRAFAELLRGPASEDRGRLLGELMYQSHASYSACGLGCTETDLLVDLAREADEVFGAKITGGGSGGTVAVLGRKDAAPAIEKIAHRFAQHTGRRPKVFAGSSPGAAGFGFMKVQVRGS